jgi:hypothetical protein
MAEEAPEALAAQLGTFLGGPSRRQGFVLD